MRKVFIVAAMAFLAMGAQAQNLVKNGNFDTPLNNEKTYASIPSTEDWLSALQQMTKSMAMPSRLKQRLTTHGTKLI